MQVALPMVPATQPFAVYLPLELWQMPRAATLLQHHQQKWLAGMWLCKGLCLRAHDNESILQHAFRHASLLDA